MELEVTSLVWVLQCIHHLVQSCSRLAIVFTDHASTLDIVKLTTLTTISTDKLNLRLIRAADYI